MRQIEERADRAATARAAARGRAAAGPAPSRPPERWRMSSAGGGGPAGTLLPRPGGARLLRRCTACCWWCSTCAPGGASAAPTCRPTRTSGPSSRCSCHSTTRCTWPTRLIDAVCALDYPRDRLEIQVLDDSTDETTEIVARGRSPSAGARASTSTTCTAPTAAASRPARWRPGSARRAASLIAVFDADFVPRPTSCKRSVPYFADPRHRHGPGELGAHQPRLLAADPGRRRSCSTATS